MIASLLAAVAGGRPKLLFRRLLVKAVVYAVVVVLAVIGIGFLIAAGYIATEERIGPLHAALAFGSGFVLVALILYLAALITANAAARRRERERKAAEVSSLIAAVLALVPTLLRSRAGTAELLAPLVAMMAMMIYDENWGNERRPPPSAE